MKKNKDIVFEFVQKEVLAAGERGKGLMTNDIADRIRMQRTNVSAILNELVKEGRLIKTRTRPVYYTLPQESNEQAKPQAFENMVGWNGSLRKAIQQAQTALLYPCSNLNIQLLAASGSGITCFGKEIYRFALEKNLLVEKAPYIYINCRHYTKNINVLSDVLFGDVTSIENSCFAKSQGGMLFLDNVDLLDAKQYSRICQYLETGEIYSANGGKVLDCSDCFFIFATAYSDGEAVPTDWSNSMTVELPRLSERPLEEKFALLNQFFTEEAGNAKRSIEVTTEAVRALMAFKFTQGIKEMRLSIRSACANAYIRVLDEPEQNMRVCLNDFKENVQRGLLVYPNKRTGIDELVGAANFMLYDMQAGLVDTKEMQFTDDVYDNIKYQYEELSERGVSDGSIREVIEAYVETITRMVPDREREKQGELNPEYLAKTVDVAVINAVSLFADNWKKEKGAALPNKVFYGMCLHLNSLLMMQPSGRKRISDEQVKQVIRDYPSEYGTMIEFARILEEMLHISISVEEVVLLTMFVIEPETDKTKHQPVLLYAMHGSGTAKYLAETTNALTQENNAYAFDMDFSYDAGTAMADLEELIITINNGGGVIVIYDTGSFSTMLDVIAEHTNIKIRCINIPVTLTGVEVARRCARDGDIDRIYHTVNQELRQLLHPAEELKRIIVTLCHTSEGGAIQLKKYIDQYSKLHMRTIPLAVADKDNLIREVMELKKTYTIHAFVGTFDPQLFGIPFISIADVFESSKEDLDRVLMFEPVHKHQMDYDAILANWREEFTNISFEKLRKLLPKVVEELGTAYSLQEGGKMGLFVHMACMLENLASAGYACRNKGGAAYAEKYREDYLFVAKTLKVLEKQFKIIINDEEIGIIIMMLR